MSKPSSQKQRSRASEQRRAQSNDRAIYLGFIIIGCAVAAFAWLVWNEQWRPITLGYIIAVAWLINLYALLVYQGRHLAHWKQSLARLPLRCAGFGTRGGKPVDAAHGAPAARTAIILSIVVSLVVVAAAAWWLLPGVRVWGVPA